jgi:hypothetical protein
MVDERPAWARRIRAEREARGWSQADAVHALRAHGDQQTPGQESLLRQWKRWEAGVVEPGHYQALLDGLAVVVDKLGVDYSREPAEQLRAEGLDWLRRVTAMLDRRLTLKQHREVLSLAGRVALLVGCVEADMGLRGPAEATRRAAMSLGEESDDKDVIGWAWEMSAWFNLTQGEYRAAVAATTAGLAAGGPDPGGVVEVALHAGRAVLEALPDPANVANHFVVDPSKWDFYTQDCYRHVGDDNLARLFATEVIRTGTDWDGTVLRPMRVAEAEITLGVLAARAGDLDSAIGAGRRALQLGRRSLPSLVLNARELTSEIQRRFPDEQAGVDFAEELRTALAA